MSIFKCKMCGGALEISGNETVATCEYCGTQQTLPRLDDDRRANLYDRANHFRRNNDFDKAAGIYEQILNEDNTDAEAYWSLVLCRYGIEYVEDPTTHKRVPTVNRAQFTSIFADEDYKSALRYADGYQKRIYEAEAKTIDEIQKGILAISQKEEPFDVFICYKETDSSGRRTQDSVLANELYHQLTQEGFKVFFSRITLEDKLGTAYEPYIFAALNSAKVMVVLGTKPEYFSAVWVKNEWSRYLALVKNSGGKKVLIPAYRDMDPYDLPEEFSHLQAQDMSKLGFMQDLIRGIQKILGAAAPKERQPVAVQQGSASAAPLLKRAFMFLEDGDWNSADEYCEKVLDMDPEDPSAYLGKLLSELRVRRPEALKDQAEPFDRSNNYQKAIRFGDAALKAELRGYITQINERNENARLTRIYDNAVSARNAARDEAAYKAAAKEFRTISGFRDADTLAKQCMDDAEVCRKDAIYSSAKMQMTRERITSYEDAIKLFQSISGWKDADAQIAVCQKRIEEIKAKEEADRLEAKRKAEAERLEAERKAEAERLEAERRAEAERLAAEKAAKKRKKIIAITAPIVCACIAFVIVLITVILPNGKYNNAIALMDEGKYDEAITAFEALDGYKDSKEMIYTVAATLEKDGMLAQAAIAFEKLGDFSDAKERSFALWDRIAERDAVAAGFAHTVGQKSDGTVVAVGWNLGGECDVSNWTDIVAIFAGDLHTIGLKSDGTVVAIGNDLEGQCDVSDWTDIVAISAGKDHTVGLKSDGTVVAVGNNDGGQCDVSGWTDIVAISAGGNHTVGLKGDGTVVAVGRKGDGQCDVSGWTDIVAISTSAFHTVGLKSDGTVVATGKNSDGQCDVSGWTDIVAISAGGYHTVGLKSDGTVVGTGRSNNGQCDVSGWTGIVAISAGDYHTVGLKSDGTVVAVGDNEYGQCRVSGWSDIKLPENG